MEIIFNYLVNYFSQKFVDGEIRKKLDLCILQPREYTFTIPNYQKTLSSFKYPGIEWKNMLYIYPDLDKYYNTEENHPLKLENYKNTYYAIRLDGRVGYMMVLAMYKTMMLDFDMKDYNVETKQELKQKILLLLKSINKKLKDGNFKPFVWHMSETDRGYHFFLLNYTVDYTDESIRKFLVLICTDINYAVFSHYHGFCVRLSKKEGRESDYVAKQTNILLPMTIKSSLTYESIIYDNIKDIQNINLNILKMIILKYNLIDYFSGFSIKYYDYMLFVDNLGLSGKSRGQMLIDKIRDHIKNITLSINMYVDEKFSSMLTLDSVIDILNYRNQDIKMMFDEIRNVVEPKVTQTTKIIELNGGSPAFYSKYIKYKHKYLMLKNGK